MAWEQGIISCRSLVIRQHYSHRHKQLKVIKMNIPYVCTCV